MQDDQRKIVRSLIPPGIFIIILWLVKIFEITTQHDLSVYGLVPLTARGLLGILTCPLLHLDFAHLFANSVPLFFLGGMLLFFYREIAYRVFFLTWIITGIWVWCLARGEAVHIGASGVVYGLASFLFFSGIIRREAKLMALTLLVAFLYGGLVWGIFPQFFPQQHISWESHLMGLLAGVVLAIYYRKIGTQRKEYLWADENEEDDTFNGEWQEDPEPHAPLPPAENKEPDPDSGQEPPIKYHYKE
jgi:membrane associated rhomboid family serine protease